MPIGTGTWDFNGNGFTGQLRLDQVNPDGNVTGVVLGDNFRGLWDEDAQRIRFVRRLTNAGSDITAIQMYTGYFFNGGPVGEQLAGTFEALQGGGGNRKRTEFGWTAFLTAAN